MSKLLAGVNDVPVAPWGSNVFLRPIEHGTIPWHDSHSGTGPNSNYDSESNLDLIRDSGFRSPISFALKSN